MCGIVGVIGAGNQAANQAAKEVFLGLTTLQHRGQDAAGILSYNSEGFHQVKNLGLVESVFTREKMDTLTGNAAIGHARYSTIGRGDLVDVQPFVLSYPLGLSIIHNGNILNADELGKELEKRRRWHRLTRSDSEVLLHLLGDGLARHLPAVDSQAALDIDNPEVQFKAICQSVGEIFEKANGSYSVVSLMVGFGMVAFRDPHGIRPLVWGKRANGSLPTGEAHIFASESVALGFLGYEKERDLEAGEVIFIDRFGKVHAKVLTKKPVRHCMFEWVYFSSPESDIDGTVVYGSRIQLGRSLGRIIQTQISEGKIKPDVIVPVPETSRIAAISLSEELKIPYREVLIKNRYIKRTFILNSQEKRQQAVDLKLSPVKSEIEGKCVLLVDDSIVRGTTSRRLIELVRKAGAKEVYFVSTCPPIRYPCFYGIDFPVREELIASKKDINAIRDELGADAVIYQDLDGLKNAMGSVKNKLCTACLTGEYVTNVEAAAEFSKMRSNDRERSPGSESVPT